MKFAKREGPKARIIAVQFDGKPDWKNTPSDDYPSYIKPSRHAGGNHATWHQKKKGEGFWEFLGPRGWLGHDWEEGAKGKKVHHTKYLPWAPVAEGEEDRPYDNTIYGVVSVPPHIWRPEGGPRPGVIQALPQLPTGVRPK